MTTIPLTPNTPVGKIASTYPRSTKVFARHGLDFCCGGGKPLSDACAARGLDVDALLVEIQSEIDRATGAEHRWVDATPAELIEHIVATYHVPLREELPRLEAMATKVRSVHHDKMPEVLDELAETVKRLRDDLEGHMKQEERELFPVIQTGDTEAVATAIPALEAEHDAAGSMLRRLRVLTNDYTPPDGACTTWRALWDGLRELETEMHEHIHLENNVLFPASVRGEAPRA